MKEIKQEIIIHNIKQKKQYQYTKEQEAKEFYEKAIIIPIFFNAWRFEKEDHLIIPLFKTMLEEVKSSEFISIKDKLYIKLYILSMALTNNLQIPKINFKNIDFKKLFSGDFSQLINNISGFFNIEGVNKESSFEKLVDELRATGAMDSIYLNIPQWIEKIAILDNVRFVFLIDDLDRCLPENSVRMLESIKLFLDVPGCSFILAVDDDIIERGVEHHYKEYLISLNNNTIINCQNSEGLQEEKSKEHSYSNINNINNKTKPPITGSEYLEKIVQLPFRIPHFDEEDVKTLFEKNFRDIFIIEDKNLQTNEVKEAKNTQIKKDEELLEFLSKNTPPNARKILRVGNLYKLKYDLIKNFENKESIDRILIAKITLLELFAPKLFRYCRNNGIEDTFKRIEDWVKNEKIESLREIQKIKEKIVLGNLPQKEADIAYTLLTLIDELVHSRIPFDVDNIFQNIDYKKLKSYLYLKSLKEKKEILLDEDSITKLPPKDKKRFEEYIFSNDELSWQKAFSEDENLKEHLLEPYEEFYQKAKDFASNPKWLEIIAKHLSKKDFLKLIKQTKPFERLLKNG